MPISTALLAVAVAAAELFPRDESAGSWWDDAYLSVALKERSVFRGKRLHNDRPRIPPASSMPGLKAAPSGLPPVSDADVVRAALSKCHSGRGELICAQQDEGYFRRVSAAGIARPLPTIAITLPASEENNVNKCPTSTTAIMPAKTWVLLATVLTMMGCASQPAATISTAGENSLVITQKLTAAAWKYPEISGNVNNWATNYPLCGSTTVQQSPIDLTALTTTPLAATIKVLPPGTYDAHDLNLAFATQMEVSTGSKNVVYTVVGYHVHSGAEHIVLGITNPTVLASSIEVHFKARDKAGGWAVFAVPMLARFDPPPTGGSWPGDAFIANLMGIFTPNPTQPLPDLAPGILTNFSGSSFYTYVGSLTTPPCSAPVQWYILKNPISYTFGNGVLLSVSLGIYKVPMPNNRLPKTILSTTTVSSN